MVQQQVIIKLLLKPVRNLGDPCPGIPKKLIIKYFIIGGDLPHTGEVIGQLTKGEHYSLETKLQLDRIGREIDSVKRSLVGTVNNMIVRKRLNASQDVIDKFEKLIQDKKWRMHMLGKKYEMLRLQAITPSFIKFELIRRVAGYFAMSEIEFYDHLGKKIDPKTHVISVRTSPSHGNGSKALLIDGDTRSNWGGVGGPVWHAINSGELYVRIKFNKPMHISKVKIYARTDCCMDRGKSPFLIRLTGPRGVFEKETPLDKAVNEINIV
jgi:hypothetical protein